MGLSEGPKILGFLPTTSPSFFLQNVSCIVKCFTPRNAEVTHLFSSSVVWHLALPQAQSSSPAHSVATVSQTHPRLCQPHMCFHLVWLLGSLYISIAFVVCHHFVLLHLNTCFSESITTFGLRSQTHPMAPHMPSAISFIFFPYFPCVSFVSHPLILSTKTNFRFQSFCKF